MKNQITSPKWHQTVLTVLFALTISFSSFAQGGPGGGHHGGGHHGGGNPGGGHPGGGHPGGGHPAIACNAHFAHLRDSVVNSIRFFNHPGSGAATFAWDFGDGSTSTSSNPTHAFADTGFYYVCLTVTDTIGGGCTETHCDSIHLFYPAPHCDAHFIARPDSIANGVRFKPARGPMNSSSTATYSWDFGDGNTSTSANATNLYAAAGIYYVCLIVSNTTAGGSCTETWCDSVDTDHPGHGGHHPHHPMKLANPNSDNTGEVTATLYPNPMVESSTVHIENTTGTVVFNVYTMTGQVAMTKILGNGDFRISKENLKEGLYFYSIEDGNNNVAKGKLRVY